jgi:hypothetical protein
MHCLIYLGPKIQRCTFVLNIIEEVLVGMHLWKVPVLGFEICALAGGNVFLENIFRSKSTLIDDPNLHKITELLKLPASGSDGSSGV